jgi:hypothetical protein
MKGCIKERSPGRFAIIIEMRDPATGQRKRKWHSFRGNKREAQIECAKLIAAVGNGDYVEPTKTPWPNSYRPGSTNGKPLARFRRGRRSDTGSF